MVEWSITVVLKTTVPRGTGGSNPSLSAKNPRNLLKISRFLFLCKNCSPLLYATFYANLFYRERFFHKFWMARNINQEVRPLLVRLDSRFG